MGISMEVIGYVLYAGLGMSILSFLLLVMSMFGKKEAEPIYDQAMSGDYVEELYEEEDEYEEVEEKPKRKSIFGFGKKNNAVESDFKDLEEDGYEEDYEQDEYKDEFEFSFREEESVKRNRETISGFNLEKYNNKDEDDDFSNMEIKQYEETQEEESYNRMDDADVDEEEEMLKRIEQYKNKFKN